MARDQIGRVVKFSKTPQRIVSLVPSISELVIDLGLDLVGRTKFCIHPDSVRSVNIIGGTKNVKIDAVRELKPDLVIANKEENPKRVVTELEKDIPVWVTDVKTVDDCMDMIESIGTITRRQSAAKEIVGEIKSGFTEIEQANRGKTAVRGLYLIWKNPYMAAGTDTFISEVMKQMGIANVLEALGEDGKRYPKLEVEDIRRLNPELILLSSEPFPFKEKHAEEMRRAVEAKCRLVNGEYFSWYGSRMAKGISYLKDFSRLY